MAPPPPAHCQVPGCDFVTDEGIQTYGDRRQELLLHVNMVHLAAATQREPKLEEVSGANRFAAKLDKPTVKLNCTEEGWAMFSHQWDIYKKTCGLFGDAALYQLYNCLPEDVSLKIFNMTRGMTKSEEELLRKLKSLVCEKTSKIVKVVEFR